MWHTVKTSSKFITHCFDILYLKFHLPYFTIAGYAVRYKISQLVIAK